MKDNYRLYEEELRLCSEVRGVYFLWIDLGVSILLIIELFEFLFI